MCNCQSHHRQYQSASGTSCCDQVVGFFRVPLWNKPRAPRAPTVHYCFGMQGVKGDHGSENHTTKNSLHTNLTHFLLPCHKRVAKFKQVWPWSTFLNLVVSSFPTENWGSLRHYRSLWYDQSLVNSLAVPVAPCDSANGKWASLQRGIGNHGIPLVLRIVSTAMASCLDGFPNWRSLLVAWDCNELCRY